MTRKYDLGQRAEGVEETRQRILHAAWRVTEASGFAPASIDDIASEAGVGRATVFRHFGSKTALHEAAMWDRMSRADLDRIDAAHQLADPVDALAAVLRANCEMFDQIGDVLARCLEVARTNDAMAHLVDIGYRGRRVDAMIRLAHRLHDADLLAHGWTTDQVADALIVLTSLEAYQTLTRHRDRSTRQAAERLFGMAQVFLASSRR